MRRLSGVVSGRPWRVMKAAFLLVFSFVLSSCVPATAAPPTPTPTPIRPDEGRITVYVRDGATGKSVDDVVVRLTNSSVADGSDHRQLLLPSCDLGQFLVVSAPTYETHFTACNGSDTYIISLHKLNAVDNINYVWSSAYTDCDSCHQGQIDAGYNEIDEWAKSGHAKVFIDPYFMSMYRGTNVNLQSPVSTEYGPGFKLDNPTDAGNCAYCHAPSVISSSLAPTDLSSHYPRPGGANGEGVTCDICHKAIGVDVSDPNADHRGVLSLQFLRAANQFVLGSFSNIILPSYDESQRHSSSSCSPVLGTSEFCAACHYGKFNETMIYNSYGEWSESRYGRNKKASSYKTCQDCHMSHMDVKNVNTPLSDREACSETTVDFQNFDHNMMAVETDETGKTIPHMIQNAASLKVKLKFETGSNSLKVRVEVENTKAGHKFPTDSPLRHLILVVSVADQFDYPLTPSDGPRLPAWTGQGSEFMRLNGVEGYSDQPGVAYANLLVDGQTNISPAVAFWNKTIYSPEGGDTRLSPRDPQASEYFFPVPDLGEMHVTVKLIYRYAFYELMDQKDWVRPDVVVAMARCNMSVEQAGEMDCPEVEP